MDSFEQAAAAAALEKFASDLLEWAKQPQRDGLPDGWRAAYQDRLNEVAAPVRRAFAEDRQALAKLREVESEARDFIGILAANPAIARKPVSEWPVVAFRETFERLAAGQRWFEDRVPVLDAEHAAQSEREPSKVEDEDPPPDDTAAALVTVKTLARYAGVTIEAVKLHIKGIDAIQGDANKAKRYRYSDVLPALKNWSSSTRNRQTKGIQWPEDPAKLSDPVKLPPKLPPRGKPRKTR